MSRLRFILSLLLTLTLLFAATKANAAWYIDRSGTLIEVDGTVLGDDESTEEDEYEEEDSEDPEEEDEYKEDDDNGDDSAKEMMEQARELEKKRLEQATEARIKLQEVRRESMKSFLEVEDGALRVRQEVVSSGRPVRTTETDLEPKQALRIHQVDGEELELNPLDDDSLEIVRNRIKARTTHPITIGENNELIITRPDGTQKTVTILPDTAADNMREQGFTVNEEEEIELEFEDETPVYKLKVKKTKRFLGLFRTEYDQETVVSAETGELIEESSTEVSPLRRLLESLSF